MDAERILGGEGIRLNSGHLKGLGTGVRRMIDNMFFKEEMRAISRRFVADNRSVEKMVEKVVGLFE